jgi:hypothetical protein
MATDATDAGDDWTDGNAHDPGVTLLELLIYTLDDLAAGVARRAGDPRQWRRVLVATGAAAAAGATLALVLTRRRRARRPSDG